ncbi:MAG TPA: M20/M25/M40 family metallo-hydrolase [Sphingobacteriaceae bacterium]|nr:M20/M25/M40 family metallo-hydrolase [Sphingobacteriaceae bacterium]
MKTKLLIFFILLNSGFASAQLSKEEKKIITYINAHFKESEDLLIESVNINSGTLNVEGVRKVGDVYRKEFDRLGFKTEWVSMPDSLKRAGHLVATRQGSKGKKIFIIGHLDTVFEPDMSFSPYTKLNDSTATGQGVNDMKGGDVVVISALKALNSLGLLKNTQLIVYFTGDEERKGSPYAVARKDFIERGRTCDVALSFETAQGLNSVLAARRGSTKWQLKVTANTGHSAGIFGNSGYGAIYEASRIINTFREELPEKNLTFNPGLIAGGSEVKFDNTNATAQLIGKSNIIPPSTFVVGDLRFISEEQEMKTREKMRVIVAQSLKGTKSEITFFSGLPAMQPTDGNYQLVKLIDKVSNDMGIGNTVAGDPGGRGAADISDVAKYLDAVDGLGTSGGGAHKPGEWINLKHFPLQIQRAALLIYRLTKEK